MLLSGEEYVIIRNYVLYILAIVVAIDTYGRVIGFMGIYCSFVVHQSPDKFNIDVLKRYSARPCESISTDKTSSRCPRISPDVTPDFFSTR